MAKNCGQMKDNEKAAGQFVILHRVARSGLTFCQQRNFRSSDYFKKEKNAKCNSIFGGRICKATVFLSFLCGLHFTEGGVLISHRREKVMKLVQKRMEFACQGRG